MKVKIKLNSASIDADEMEDISSIVDEAKDLAETFDRDLQMLQDDFSSYGELNIVGDNCKDQEPDLAEAIRKRVAEKTAAATPQAFGTNPNGIKFSIFTEKGTELRPTEMLRGNNKGQIALMWPSGGFLHNDPQTNDDNLQRLYSEANVPVGKRASWKPAWRRNSF